MVAGLMMPDHGRIEVGGETWFDGDKKFSLHPQARRIGFVFQDFALFPNMTVRENVIFALEDRKDTGYAGELLDIVRLKELKDQLPSKLSAGQKQRVALARALARKPMILLMDEPFCALDGAMRLKLQDELLEIYKRFGITTIFVSHDMSEVYKMSHRVFIIDKGRILRSGKPEDIFIEDHLSGKFKFIGKIVDIKKDGFLNILVVEVGNNLVRVVATEDEMAGLEAGQSVVVASKAFNPIVMRY
jgi:molybdate transport system ATP-binding protein